MSKSNAGMSLVEVLVSLVIVFIVFLGLSSGGLLVLDRNIKNSLQDEAVSVAEAEVQRLRSVPLDNLVLGATTQPAVSRQIRGLTMNYTVTDTVTFLDARNRQVMVTIGWTRMENGQPKSYNHQVQTIVRSR